MPHPDLKTEGGPLAVEPGNRRRRVVATAAQQSEHVDVTLVADVAGLGDRQPVAFATAYPPVKGRAWISLSIACPFCGGVHLGRVRDLADADGPRRVPCGRVTVIVHRDRHREGPAREVAT